MAEHSENLRGNPEVLNLCFRHLTYTSTAKRGKQKEILHDISGQILSGRLTAILGPSGAGKTSLLHVLSGFKVTGVQGSVLVNGVDRNLEEFRTQSCYITQEHSLLDRLTTLETLMVAARLKLTTSHTEQSQVVSDIIDLLGLSKTRDTFVQNLSGGEKKRLSIGVELITNPPIMFFDEPTSGLDSVSSAQIMYHLRSLASSGRTVACVIHQPNSRLCSLFDDVILLAEGQLLYCGSLTKMVPVFEEEGFPYPDFYSRADFALEIACQERGQDLSKLVQRFRIPDEDTLDSGDFELLSGGRNGSVPNEVVIVPVKNKSNTILNKVVTNFKGKRRKYPISRCLQLWILLRRALLYSSRDLHMCRMRLSAHVFIGVLLGVIFYDIGNDAAKINSNAACIFFFVMFLFFSNAMPTTLTFPSEMSVFLREHLNNWYSLSPYFFAKCIANIPLQLLCPISFFFVAYWMTGQPTEWWRMNLSLLPCILLVVTSQGLSMSIGAACGIDLGIFMVTVVSIPILLFSGFFQRLQDIPYYLKWVSYLSPFKNAFEAISVAVYGLDRPKMDCSEAFCFFRQGDKFLAHLGMSETYYWNDIVELSLWAILTHVVLFVVLMWRIHVSK